MSDAKKCDRCGDIFSGWRPVTREFILKRDILKGRTTPSVRHKAVDLCGDCDASLKAWFDGDEEADRDE